MRVESAVEPTRSENITVTWRRSAVSRGDVSIAEGASSGGAFALASAPKAAIASSSLQPVPNCCDAKLLQGLRRQAREDRFVNLVLAECRLVLSEAKAPQPNHNVHDDAPAGRNGYVLKPRQQGSLCKDKSYYNNEVFAPYLAGPLAIPVGTYPPLGY